MILRCCFRFFKQNFFSTYIRFFFFPPFFFPLGLLVLCCDVCEGSVRGKWKYKMKHRRENKNTEALALLFVCECAGKSKAQAIKTTIKRRLNEIQMKFFCLIIFWLSFTSKVLSITICQCKAPFPFTSFTMHPLWMANFLRVISIYSVNSLNCRCRLRKMYHRFWYSKV